MTANPLSILAGPAGGASIPSITSKSSAESGLASEVYFNSPFNVGSGTLASDGANKGAVDILGRTIEAVFPVMGIALGVWLIVRLTGK